MDEDLEAAPSRKKSLKYALIARQNGTTLADLLLKHGQDEEEKLLEGCRAFFTEQLARKAKQTYAYGDYNFSYLVEDNLVFLCVSAVGTAAEKSWSFLDSARRRYRLEILGGVGKRSDLSQQALLTKLLQEAYNDSEHCEQQKIETVEHQLDGITEIMHDNISKIIGRGEQINNLVDRTQLLSEDAKWLKRNSRQLRRRYWWKSMRLKMVFSLVIAAVIIILLFLKHLGLLS